MQTTIHNPENSSRGMGQKPSVHCVSSPKTRVLARSRAFSLIELLVVVGIIALILGIGAAAAVKITAEARKEQTKAMMNGLLGANEEFKAVRKEGNVNHTGNFPINWSDAANRGSSQSSSERFISAISTVQDAKTAMMAAINSGSEESIAEIFGDFDSDGFYELRDRWGSEIEYRSANDGSGTGPVTNVDNRLLPLSRSPFFISRGPDKQFGTDDDITTIEGELEYLP